MSGQLSEQPHVETVPSTIQSLRAIWAELLNVRDVGDEDNFIDRGGDSIAATLCLIRIREVFDIEVPMETFFVEDMTLRTLAAHIDASRQGAPSDPETRLS